jgi:hypothetical protein
MSGSGGGGASLLLRHLQDPGGLLHGMHSCASDSASSAITEAAEWTAVKQLKPVMGLFKKNYARSYDVDVTALCLQLLKLNTTALEAFTTFSIPSRRW